MTAPKLIDLARQHIEAGNEESGLAILTAGIRSARSSVNANKFRRVLRDFGWKPRLENWDNPTIHDLIRTKPEKETR